MGIWILNMRYLKNTIKEHVNIVPAILFVLCCIFPVTKHFLQFSCWKWISRKLNLGKENKHEVNPNWITLVLEDVCSLKLCDELLIECVQWVRYITNKTNATISFDFMVKFCQTWENYLSDFTVEWILLNRYLYMKIFVKFYIFFVARSKNCL